MPLRSSSQTTWQVRRATPAGDGRIWGRDCSLVPEPVSSTRSSGGEGDAAVGAGRRRRRCCRGGCPARRRRARSPSTASAGLPLVASACRGPGRSPTFESSTWPRGREGGATVVAAGVEDVGVGLPRAAGPSRRRGRCRGGRRRCAGCSLRRSRSGSRRRARSIAKCAPPSSLRARIDVPVVVAEVGPRDVDACGRRAASAGRPLVVEVERQRRRARRGRRARRARSSCRRAAAGEVDVLERLAFRARRSRSSIHATSGLRPVDRDATVPLAAGVRVVDAHVPPACGRARRDSARA